MLPGPAGPEAGFKVLRHLAALAALLCNLDAVALVLLLLLPVLFAAEFV
jgi:hypothetical protein